MSKDTEETLLILAAVAGALVALYLLFKPAPSSPSNSDLSWNQAATIAGTVIAFL